ncbi:MAG: NUDIX hydrolase [Herpetosiphonaceae bacterium]|nr:NUDIX hydrolase [Herpetosiphonaceae bacterium]
MSREYPQYPVLGVAVVVWRGDQVLLVQRGKQPNYGQWNIPGGAVELGERLAEAARREIREECGVEISPPAIVTTVDILDYDDEGRLRYHYIVLEMQARWESGEPVAGDDALAVGWFRLDELDDVPMWEETRKVLRLAAGQMVG